MKMSTWKNLLEEEFNYNNESWEDVESTTLTEEELNKEFDRSYGSIEGIPFTIWTKNSVYFPICYDGAEWVGRVARNPDGKPTAHQGGG